MNSGMARQAHAPPMGVERVSLAIDRPAERANLMRAEHSKTGRQSIVPDRHRRGHCRKSGRDNEHEAAI
jgi:hypothetical protein